MFDRSQQNGERTFLRYLAEVIGKMPDTDNLSARVSFGAASAAGMLSALAVELEEAGAAERAVEMRAAAQVVERLAQEG